MQPYNIRCTSSEVTFFSGLFSILLLPTRRISIMTRNPRALFLIVAVGVVLFVSVLFLQHQQHQVQPPASFSDAIHQAWAIGGYRASNAAKKKEKGTVFDQFYHAMHHPRSPSINEREVERL